MLSSNEIATGSGGSTSKCCWPFSGVVPPHSAVISMSAPVAGIVPPSRITAAAIATARSVRSLHENAGSLRVDENCFRRATCTWSSHSPAAWLPWFCRTRKSSTISCSVPVRKLFSKWHAIRNVSARKLVSSACYTRGVSNSKFIRMFIVSFLPAASRLITPAGFAHETTTFFPRKCCVKFFAASSSTLSNRLFTMAISNHRLVSFADGQVTFRWRDSAHHNQQKLLPLPLNEFLCRFLLHILPKGFVRIRNFGFLANRKRATLLPLCFQLLGSAQRPQDEQHASSTEDFPNSWRCPKCGGPMKVIERLTAAEIQLRSPPRISSAA